MGKKVTRTTTWTEVDSEGRVTEVKVEKTCGPVCKTVKVVATVGVIAIVLGALSSK